MPKTFCVACRRAVISASVDDRADTIRSLSDRRAWTTLPRCGHTLHLKCAIKRLDRRARGESDDYAQCPECDKPSVPRPPALAPWSDELKAHAVSYLSTPHTYTSTAIRRGGYAELAGVCVPCPVVGCAEFFSDAYSSAPRVCCICNSGQVAAGPLLATCSHAHLAHAACLLGPNLLYPFQCAGCCAATGTSAASERRATASADEPSRGTVPSPHDCLLDYGQLTYPLERVILNDKRAGLLEVRWSPFFATARLQRRCVRDPVWRAKPREPLVSWESFISVLAEWRDALGVDADRQVTIPDAGLVHSSMQTHRTLYPSSFDQVVQWLMLQLTGRPDGRTASMQAQSAALGAVFFQAVWDKGAEHCVAEIEQLHLPIYFEKRCVRVCRNIQIALVQRERLHASAELATRISPDPPLLETMRPSEHELAEALHLVGLAAPVAASATGREPIDRRRPADREWPALAMPSLAPGGEQEAREVGFQGQVRGVHSGLAAPAGPVWDAWTSEGAALGFVAYCARHMHWGALARVIAPTIHDFRHGEWFENVRFFAIAASSAVLHRRAVAHSASVTFDWLLRLAEVFDDTKGAPNRATLMHREASARCASLILWSFPTGKSRLLAATLAAACARDGSRPLGLLLGAAALVHLDKAQAAYRRGGGASRADPDDWSVPVPETIAQLPRALHVALLAMGRLDRHPPLQHHLALVQALALALAHATRRGDTGDFHRPLGAATLLLCAVMRLQRPAERSISQFVLLASTLHGGRGPMWFRSLLRAADRGAASTGPRDDGSPQPFEAAAWLARVCATEVPRRPASTSDDEMPEVDRTAGRRSQMTSARRLAEVDQTFMIQSFSKLGEAYVHQWVAGDESLRFGLPPKALARRSIALCVTQSEQVASSSPMSEQSDDSTSTPSSLDKTRNESTDDAQTRRKIQDEGTDGRQTRWNRDLLLEWLALRGTPYAPARLYERAVVQWAALGDTILPLLRSWPEARCIEPTAGDGGSPIEAAMSDVMQVSEPSGQPVRHEPHR